MNKLRFLHMFASGSCFESFPVEKSREWCAEQNLRTQLTNPIQNAVRYIVRNLSRNFTKDRIQPNLSHVEVKANPASQIQSKAKPADLLNTVDSILASTMSSMIKILATKVDGWMFHACIDLKEKEDQRNAHI